MTDPTESEDTDHGATPPSPDDEAAQEDAPQTDRPAGDPGPHPSEPTSVGMPVMDPEATVNLTGDFDATVNLKGGPEMLPERDDATVANEVTRGHLKGLVEALVFASDRPIKAGELAKSATAATKQVKELLEELKTEYTQRGIQLDEVAGGWIFRTNAAYAPFVRDLTKQKPVKLSRAQIETLAILAYRQPITRPEVDEIRGVDCGPVLKLLLERDLVRVLGKKDEPGRPWLYGTTSQFLEFFGLKSLRDLPTLREFTDLNEESRRTVERELGETLVSTEEAEALSGGEAGGIAISSDTLPPDMMNEAGTSPMNTEIPPAGTTSDSGGEEPGTQAEGESAPASASANQESAKSAELDPEEEFPDDDDADFDEDDEEDEDEDEDGEDDEDKKKE